MLNQGVWGKLRDTQKEGRQKQYTEWTELENSDMRLWLQGSDVNTQAEVCSKADYMPAAGVRLQFCWCHMQLGKVWQALTKQSKQTCVAVQTVTDRELSAPYN